MKGCEGYPLLCMAVLLLAPVLFPFPFELPPGLASGPSIFQMSAVQGWLVSTWYGFSEPRSVRVGLVGNGWGDGGQSTPCRDLSPFSERRVAGVRYQVSFRTGRPAKVLLRVC